MAACSLILLTVSLLLSVALALPVAKSEGWVRAEVLPRPETQRTLDDMRFKSLGGSLGSIIGGSLLPFQQQVEAAGFDFGDFLDTVGKGIRIYNSLHPLVQAEVMKSAINRSPKFQGPLGAVLGGWLGDMIGGEQAQAAFDLNDLSNLVEIGLDVYDKINSQQQAKAAKFGLGDAIDLVNTGLGVYDRFHTSEQAEAAKFDMNDFSNLVDLGMKIYNRINSQQQAEAAKFGLGDALDLVNTGLGVYDRFHTSEQAEAAKFGLGDALDLVNTGLGVYDRFHTSEQAEAETHMLNPPPFDGKWPIYQEADN